MNNLNTYISQNNYPVSNVNFSIESPKNETTFPEISKKSEFMVNTFQGCKKPTVQDLVSVEEILEIIKNGNEYLTTIKKAREFGKGHDSYKFIKDYNLPSTRFNFQYKDYATDDNMVAPTGLIYLDADDTDAIPESEYVFAKWRSLSNTGYAVLVKVENLTKTNFHEIYNQLSEVIGIKSDTGARKPIQQNVLSFDSNLYHNPDSLIYSYIEKKEIKKVSFSNIKKGKRGIVSKDTFFKNEDEVKYRNDTIGDYFKGEFADVPFRFFDKEKTKICQPFTPFKSIIKEGQRNLTMLTYLSMYASLNPDCDKEFLLKMSNYMNYKMHPKLPKSEIVTIINNIIKRKKKGGLEMYLNKERRILFNPNMKFTRKEKCQIIGREMGNFRRDKTSLLIYQAIEDWDFEANGKITQKKVAEKVVRAEGTIKKYWSEFKDYARDLNTDYSLCDKPSQ